MVRQVKIAAGRLRRRLKVPETLNKSLTSAASLGPCMLHSGDTFPVPGRVYSGLGPRSAAWARPHLQTLRDQTKRKQKSERSEKAMKKILLGMAGLMALGIAAPASAADLAARPYAKA